MKIGVFDSGLGGLTIFNEMLKQINADFYYLGDNKNTPYGTKREELVKEYIFDSVEKLVNIGCKIIVIACNTATAIAIDELRKKYSEICIIGTEPAVKKAVDINSENKKIIICATTITINSQRLQKLISRLNAKSKVVLLPLDTLVTLVEEKDVDNNQVEDYLKESFSNINLEECESIVLGCTHFPFFKPQFQNVLPNNIKIIDSSVGVTKNVKNKMHQFKDSEINSKITILITKESVIFKEKVKEILNSTKREIEFKLVD